MSGLFNWHERGSGLELHDELGQVRVVLVDDDQRHEVRLSPTMLGTLADTLEVHDGCVPADEYENEVDRATALERERDEAQARVSALEGDLRHARAEIERLKSALDLGDQRARALEAELDRMRHAFDPARTPVTR